MINNQLRLHYLLKQYASDSCTRNELLELFTLIEDAGNKEQLSDSLTRIWETIAENDKLPTLDKEKIFTGITAVQPVSKQRNAGVWIKYAAAAIIFMALATGLYTLKLKTPVPGKLTTKISGPIITSGGNKAILTLANGSHVTLNDTVQGVVATQSHVPVKQLTKGELTYSSNIKATSAEASFNMLSTPVGGQYAITLGDGTKVWLDAVSSLRYPVSFTGKQRKVELTGQAYFEVAKNKDMPFIVAINHSEVKVYGTHFNIMGYAGEANTNVTLLEGSVKVTTDEVSKMLIPGQQALVTNQGIEIDRTDVEQAIAWKNGRFNFAHERIDVIMRKLSRWFNIEVVYQGNITKEGFVGTLPRSTNLAEVLQTIESTELVHFKVEGRRVTVMP